MERRDRLEGDVGPAGARRLERKKTEFALLGVAVALAAILRFTLLGQESFWYDEAWTALLTRAASLRTLLDTVGRDVHPPLYFVLAREWARWFGDSEAALRALSAIFGTLAPLLVYGLGRALRLRGPASLAGAFLLALNTQAIWYSQEARMYSLVGSLGTAHLLLAALLARRGSPGWRRGALTAAWWGTGGLCVAAHFFGVFFLLAGASALLGWAWLLARKRAGGGTERRAARRAAAARLVGTVVLGSIAWGAAAAPLFWRMLDRFRTGYRIDWLTGARVGWATPWEILGGLAIGEQISVGPALLRNATIGAAVVVLAVPVVQAIRRLNRRPATLAPLLFALVLAGVPALLSIFRPIILGGTRYVSIADAPFCLALGVGLAVLRRGRWPSHVVAAASVLLLLASDSAYLSRYYGSRQKSMWREACAAVAERDAVSPIVVYPDHMRLPVLYYDRGRRPLLGWREFLAADPGSRRVWLVAEGVPALAVKPPWTVASSILVSEESPLSTVSVFLLERPVEDTAAKGSPAR